MTPPSTPPSVYTPLKHYLQDWVDLDIAEFHLARCLGILGPEYPDLSSAKWVFWSNNSTGNSISRILSSIAEAGFVEIDEKEFKVRWKQDQQEGQSS